MLTGQRLGVQASDAASNAAIRAVAVGASLAERRVSVVNSESRNRQNLMLRQHVAQGGLRPVLDGLVDFAKQLGSATFTRTKQQILKRLGTC